MTNARKVAADTISEGDVEKRGLIAVVEIARNFRVRPQTIHKIVNRLGNDTEKVTNEGTRGRKPLTSLKMVIGKSRNSWLNQAGNRFLMTIRTESFFLYWLSIVKTWPCKVLWERTAIESVTSGCERIYMEVFRTEDIRDVVERANRFFEVMPQPTE